MVAIFKDTCPEDKLTEDGQDSNFEALGDLLRRTPKGELPHLKSYKLVGGALIYVLAVLGHALLFVPEQPNGSSSLSSVSLAASMRCPVVPLASFAVFLLSHPSAASGFLSAEVGSF
jgi:hypothetical protein